MNNVTYTIGYSCLEQELSNIDLPPHNPNVEILIITQNQFAHKSDPVELLESISTREDTRLISLDSLGVAKSRNVAINEASGKYLFFGDDDITWNIESMEQIVEHFDNSPSLSLVLAQGLDGLGKLRKNYPNHVKLLNRYNSAKAATYEIAIRVQPFRSNNIYFNPSFGAGMINHLGDEYIFISDACKAGLTCKFIPIPLATHASSSSGDAFGTMNDARSRAAVFNHVFGKGAPFIRLAFICRHLQKFKNLKLIIQFLFNRFGNAKTVNPKK